MRYGVFYTIPERWVGWNYWYHRVKEPTSMEETEALFLEWAKTSFNSTSGLHYIVANHSNEKGL